MGFGADAVQPSASPKCSKYQTGLSATPWLLPSGSTLQGKAAKARGHMEPRGRLSLLDACENKPGLDTSTRMGEADQYLRHKRNKK